MTHGEIWVIAARNHWGERKRAALQLALDNMIDVDISHTDVISAYVDIDIYSQNHPDGARNMGKNDLWIASCAKVAESTLLTTDRDFDHLTPALLSVEYIDPNCGRDT